MIRNRYYIVDLSMENMIMLVNKIVGNLQEQRINNTQTKMVVKLAHEDTNDYPELSLFSEFDYEGILVELKKPEWN